MGPHCAGHFLFISPQISLTHVTYESGLSSKEVTPHHGDGFKHIPMSLKSHTSYAALAWNVTSTCRCQLSPGTSMTDASWKSKNRVFSLNKVSTLSTRCSWWIGPPGLSCTNHIVIKNAGFLLVGLSEVLAVMLWCLCGTVEFLVVSGWEPRDSAGSKLSSGLSNPVDAQWISYLTILPAWSGLWIYA